MVRTVTRGASAKSVAKTADTNPAPKKAAKKSDKDIMSDPRLIDFMERSKYEAYVDPYRGMFPFFHLSFPIEDATICNDCASNETNSTFEPGQNVFVDEKHAAVIISICRNEKSALVKWATCQKEDSVDMDRITPMETGKTRSGRSSTTGHAKDTNGIRNETDPLQQQMLHDKPSPWMKCSDALSSSTWQFIDRDCVEVINVDNPAENTSKQTTIVLCNCSSVNEWAESEYASLAKERMASLKKGKKKKGRRKKDVAALENDMDVVEKNQGGFEEHSFICGKRGTGECLCDYNPFCLASIGGLFDEYRYNVARMKQTFLKDGNSTLCGKEFAALLRKNWTDIPVFKSTSSERQHQNSSIRSSIMVERHKVESHISNNVSSPDEKLTVERCMSMLLGHHKVMIMPSIQTPTEVFCNSNIQLSKPPGLRNLGATCYLNSQLQCLAMNLRFMCGLLAWKPTPPDTNDPRIQASASRMNDVLSSMQSILARMRYGHERIICTNEFALSLGLENDEMQDPNEFAGLLFEKIHASFNQSSQLDKLLPSIYWGKSSINTICSECSYTSKTVDDFKFLTVPIKSIVCDEETNKTRGSGLSCDVDVQQLLDLSLHPEVLDGDNQYFCPACNKKCDAMRHPNFEYLPPVLNLQLNRYVFNMESFSKQKCITKVLIPHSLTVPMGNGKKKYILVAVQNHLGNSAHGGHYVANAMDWNTGVWFEFNDEDVDVLSDGPLSSFYPSLAEKEGNTQKISGSSDAYNILYVEMDYFSASVRRNLKYCEEMDEACTQSTVSTNFAKVEDETYQFYSSMRLEQYRLESEEHVKRSKQKARLAFRKEQLINELFCSRHETTSFESIKWNDCNKVLVKTDILKRFFSCNDGLDDVFESIILNKPSLCQHDSGIHPATAAKFKLVPNHAFVIISKVLASEYTMFLEGEKSIIDSEQFFHGDDLALHDNKVMCPECSKSYQLELRQKCLLVENLVAVYEELHSGSSDLGVDSLYDASCVISKRFVTSYCKYVEGMMKTLLNAPKLDAKQMPRRVDLSSLDLSGLSGANGNENIDLTVNSNITCEHGNCSLMHNKRSSLIVPMSLWAKIIKIFPDAIRHNFLPSSDDRIGNCRECFGEKVADERFPVKIKNWRDSIDKNPVLLQIFRDDDDVATPQENELLRLLHRKQVQGWRDCYSYLLRSKKNVSNQTVRQRLVQLCGPESSLLVCEKHQKAIGIPPLQLVKDWHHIVEGLKQCDIEMLTEERYYPLAKSIADLQNILFENDEPLDIDGIVEAPTVKITEAKNDHVLVQIQPESCDQGCVSPASNNEDSKGATKPDDSKHEKRDSQVFNILIHEVEGSMDLDVAASIIFADQTAEQAEDQPRRSRRKMKDRNFPCHSVKIPVSCNIAHLRLKVHEKTGKRLLRQCLHLLKENSGDQVYALKLEDKDNSKDFRAFVPGPLGTVYHIIMSYEGVASADESTVGANTRKRHGKIDTDAEEMILSTLTEIAFQGMGYVETGRKTKKRREERGFRGTFLHSSPNNDVINDNEC